MVLALCLIVVPANALAVTIGRSQPPSPAIIRLHLADCAPPCWVGIIPGQTSLRDAEQRLVRAFSTAKILPGIVTTPTTIGADLWRDTKPPYVFAHVVLGSVDGINVNEITINVESESAPLLSDVLVLFGSPTCQRMNALAIGMNTLFFGNKDDVRVAAAAIEPVYIGRRKSAAPVRELHFYSGAVMTCHEGYSAWRGPFRNP
jgi:hypothetical protein